MNLEKGTTGHEHYATHAKPDANCIVLGVRGKYYYTEKFGKFIQIEKQEYERILACPYRRYFTTALKKHIQWDEANRQATTLTWSEVLASNRANTTRCAIAKLVRQIFALTARSYDRWILDTYDSFILWLWARVHRWSDGNTVANAVVVSPTNAQPIRIALVDRVERWINASHLLRLVSRYVDWCQNIRPRPEVHCVGAAFLGLAVIGDWWCGGPVRQLFSVVPQPIAFGIELFFVSLTALNLMVVAVLLIALAWILPILLWRFWEVISGFILRHLLPHGIASRYRTWKLRRLHQRQSQADKLTKKKLCFMLAMKPGETVEEFTERVMDAAYRTGLIKTKPQSK